MNSSSKNGSNGDSTAAGKIEHVVVLMFENRSFDHILGAMPGVNGLLGENGAVKPEFYNTLDPTKEPGDQNPPVRPTAIVPASLPAPDPISLTETDLINHDFNHDFGDGMSQDIFGPGTTGVINGQPQGNPAVTYPATNSGFLSTVAYAVKDNPVNGKGALSYFHWDSMKVFHALAKSFVVCDAWHCDMPGHTSPNRAFMHCATTGHLGINDDDQVGSTRMVNRPTIFERIQEAGHTWKMYSPNEHCDTNWLNEKIFCQQYETQHPNAFNVTQVPISHFFTDVENDRLPFYSFVMCWSDGPDTSMHPASRVEPGENMLASIYNALRVSPYWAKTLLVVNFDENGGMYDHVSVPPATPPDRVAPISTWTSSNTDTTYSFDFSVLGVRIPVILISPCLNAGVCSTPYQNTSILRFLQDMLPNPEISVPLHLTQRDLHAPSIAQVFGYGQFGRPAMRSDCPSKVEGYSGQDAQAQFLRDITPDAATLAARPALHLEMVTKMYVGPLPGHPDSGKPITRTFATVGEMRNYARERRQAALAYLCPKRTQD